MTWTGGGDRLCVQPLGYAGVTVSRDDLGKDALHDGGFLRRPHHPLDVAVSANVPVTVHLAARHMTALDLAPERVVRPLAGLLPVHVVHEGDRMDHELVGRALALHLGVGEIAPDPDAGIGDPLDRVRALHPGIGRVGSGP